LPTAEPVKDRPSKSTVPHWRKLIVAACLLAGCLFFFRGLPSSSDRNERPMSPIVASSRGESRYVTSNIEDLRVGDWVLADNPELEETEYEYEAPAAVELDGWRTVGLRMAKADGGRLDMVLLRPVEWLEECGYTLGATVDVELPELGAEGPAEVLSIGPCPAIAPPPSSDCRLITGTFAHSSGEIIDVRIEGLEEPIGCTANHPFWSEDRQEFVEAGDLLEGETLLTADDTPAHVITVTPRETTEPVYNLEVDLDHVYYVSTSGVLVHNAYPGKPKTSQPPKTSGAKPNSAKPSLSAVKSALKKVYAKVGKLPKGKPGKYGSPQRGTPKKGYRLDPPHPNAQPGSPETSPQNVKGT